MTPTPRIYGIVAASFSAVVATAAFASLSADTVPAWLKLLAGLFGTTAAVVAGMEATLKYPEMAINYRAAANKYEKVLHQAELLELEPTVHEADVRKIATAWEAVAAEVPIISDRQYARAEKHVDVAERKQADEAHQAASLKAA